MSGCVRSRGMFAGICGAAPLAEGGWALYVALQRSTGKRALR
ncbi:MAG: hypothetical protein R3A52_17270 [Polyangiales bacterium]